MIEKMKKTTVVCITADRAQAVGRLAELGAVHVVDVTAPESPELDRLLAARDRATRAQLILSACAAAEEATSPAPAAERIVEQAISLQETVRQAEEAIRQHQQNREQLLPWGSFSRETIDRLAAGGYQVRLCAVNEKNLPGNLPQDVLLEVISRANGMAYCALIAPAATALGDDVPAVCIPEETDIATLERRIAECERRIADSSRQLADLAAHAGRLAEHQADLEARIGQVRAHDGMGTSEHLAYLQGYVPEKRLGDLDHAATAHGWALMHEEVDTADAAVPTLLTVPKWLRISKPIFEFIGILPGYREADVSSSVLIFLTLFFGIIIGDAGYGLIFMVLGALGWLKIKNPAKRRPVNLFLLMSATTFLWGALSGNWFAIPGEHLPAPMRGIELLTNAEMKDKNVQWFCFLIAAVHLSMARLWQALLRLNSRAALGHIGWGLLLWGNFFTAVELIVFKGSFPAFAYALYGVGVVLVLACGVNWRDVGDVLNLPFGFIGSFVDVLSYIRLFAVGLSSYFIAKSFNDMGAMVYDISPWLFIPAALVVVFGHLLNIALGFMGVLVHGIRLNTLEFSNHMGLTWSGRPFCPLRKAEVPAEAAP